MGNIKIFANIREEVYRAMVNIDRYDARTQAAIRGAVKGGVTAVYDAAQRRAPLGRTGNLKIGLKKEFDEAKCGGVVKTMAPHSHLIEFGTRERVSFPRPGTRAMKFTPSGDFVRGDIYTGRMTPRPFLRPAMEEQRAKIESDIERAIK